MDLIRCNISVRFSAGGKFSGVSLFKSCLPNFERITAGDPTDGSIGPCLRDDEGSGGKVEIFGKHVFDRGTTTR